MDGPWINGLIGAGAAALVLILREVYVIFTGKAESDRKSSDKLDVQRGRFEKELQDTINLLRTELKVCQEKHMEAANRAAALEERVKLLEKKVEGACPS